VKKALLAMFVIQGLCLTPQTVMAAELEEGAREVSFVFDLENTGASGTSLAVAGEFGFMVTDRHEFGPVLFVDYWNPNWSGSDSLIFGGAGVFYRYNISNRTKRLLPFVGARASLFFGDTEIRSWELRAEAGIRIIPAEGASVNFALFYRQTFLSEPNRFEGPGSRLGVTAGVSIFF